MRISFDFDSTLSQESVQFLAEILSSNKNNDIFIVTARTSRVEWNKDLFSVAEYLGVFKENIYFTEGSYKWEILQSLGIDLHFDDDREEIKLIRKNCPKMAAIQIYDPEFYD